MAAGVRNSGGKGERRRSLRFHDGVGAFAERQEKGGYMGKNKERGKKGDRKLGDRERKGKGEEQQRIDAAFMRRALALASAGRGRVEPNPLVGAVAVKQGRIIGEGYHRSFGGPHAEIEAMESTVEDLAGTTLYVTLEPCTHHGKTPPCTEAIIRAGVRRVVVAHRDPNRAVSGGGLEALEKAGIEVTVGILEKEARRLNAPFIKYVTLGIPYITCKWAMSLDGKIATRTGDSRWISCGESRNLVHRMRGEVDAILVGSETVRQDDPLLTCRVEGGRNPKRIVLDSKAGIPLDSQIVKTAREVPTIVAVANTAPEEKRRQLRDAGLDVLLPAESEHKVNLRRLFKELGAREITHILVEGGARVHASFLEGGHTDRVVIFVGPVIIGGSEAPTPVSGLGFERLNDCPRPKAVEIRKLGTDVVISGYLREY
jgi:diaminohydroxyphosphoribosylaminopyrimidine deaminase/5-amino-6-(5-phosphoribosylamino)uracil reductase